VRFVETPVFTAALRRQLDDETYRALQLALLLRPQQGRIIRGSGGLRKLRWRLPLHGRGKRGGLRLIYYWEPDQDVIYMLYLYAKNEQGDLTPGQMRVLKRLVREEFQ
jgi:mRNA-degrading endonuclease RelE of RelBE toxin-antitoxin system